MSGIEVAVVLVTGPDAELSRLAERVVDERLAACANLIPGVRSVYRWEGKLARDDEAMAILKTTKAGLPALRARVLELHPYDVPEFLALPVELGNDSYVRWIDDCVRELEANPEP